MYPSPTSPYAFQPYSTQRPFSHLPCAPSSQPFVSTTCPLQVWIRTDPYFFSGAHREGGGFPLQTLTAAYPYFFSIPPTLKLPNMSYVKGPAPVGNPPPVPAPVVATNVTAAMNPTPISYANINIRMPIPRSEAAPHYNGKYLDDFLARVEQHGHNAGITNKDELVTYIFQYCSDAVKDVIRSTSKFSKDNLFPSWDLAHTLLQLYYGAIHEEPDVSEQDLKDFTRTRSANSPFTFKAEVQTYGREFMQLSAPLIKKSLITETQCRIYFVEWIPTNMKAWFIQTLPAANRTRKSPPTIAESIKTLNKCFDPESLAYEPWKDANTGNAVSYDPFGNRIDNSQPQPRVPNPLTSHTGPAQNDQLAEISRHMEELSLNLARMNSQRLSSTPSAVGNNQKACFICNEVDAHLLHPRHCPHTQYLLSHNAVKLDPNTNRYVLPSSADLPMVPRSLKGQMGVATYLCQLLGLAPPPPIVRTASSTNVPAARTNAMGLVYEGQPIIGAHNFAMSGLDLTEKNSYPALRSGKDTDVRFDPRPPPQSIPTPPNSINCQDGWQGSRKPKSGNNPDVVMRDASKPEQKYHITFQIQELVNPTGIYNDSASMPKISIH
ncbi:hypothetical protein GGX14DRAFT_555422 [Mycena pura]|uniref:DUF4100 domain-containing protein n=1 Tax=Mycena pura TaxID=153505 RepID=A0AAD6YR06_9AGAR|nr:hypothetical protein GGX14DRAFT_555422 [Mycena pura]